MKDIPGYEGLYSISTEGKVFSWKRQKFLKLEKARNYLRVTLTDEAGNIKKWLVHRLVALTYIPNPENLPQVNHKDEDGFNNCVQNLEWCDAKYNCNYGTRTKRLIKKMGKPIKCIETGEVFDSVGEAARKLNLQASHISRVANGKLPHTGRFTFIYLDELKKNI